jgi:hypothetical protein
MGGQGDRAAEGAVAAFDPVQALLRGVVGEVTFALGGCRNGQQAVLECDLEVVGLDAWQLERDQVGVTALGDLLAISWPSRRMSNST